MESAAKDKGAQTDAAATSERPNHSKHADAEEALFGGGDKDHGAEAEQAKLMAEENGD
jgi:hypothetical protein